MMTILELAEKSQQIEHTYRVDQYVYYAFQQCSKDYNPLHTDKQFAESKGFPSCVMYGNILNAFVSHFVGMLLPTREVMIQSQEKISTSLYLWVTKLQLRLESKWYLKQQTL